jgi:hypothetical protein
MCYIRKCLATDPERRMNLIRLIVEWFVNDATALLRHITKKALGKPYIPPSIFLGELWGGVVGLLGGYSRSQRRVEAIRTRLP